VLYQPFVNPIEASAVYSPGGAFPASFPVNFDACGLAPPGARFEWRVGDGEPTTEDRCDGFDYVFPAEGSYPVSLTVVHGDGTRLPAATQDVVVQDWMIVSIGDSIASGEGNPDIQADGGLTGRASWRDPSCHRSGRAGPARAALAVEDADPRTSVTFVHLACSGATITRGLLGPQGKRAPQVDRLVELAARREVDAVLMSVGANDIGFSRIVRGCLFKEPCGGASGAGRDVGHRLEVLRTAYRSLADQLQAPIGLPAERILLTDYFNPSRDDGDSHCGKEDADADGRFLTTPEWIWAERDVLVPLNATVAEAARLHGWTPVTGFDGLADGRGFRRHGFCAKDHWVIRLGESVKRQRDLNGAVHPNELGHREYGRRLAESLTRQFYPGPTSRPRPPLVLPNDPASPAPRLSDEVLARRFVPRLLFDRSERWRPLNVDAFLEEGSHYLCHAEIKAGADSVVRDALDLLLRRERDGCSRVTGRASLAGRAPRGTIPYILVNGTDSRRVSRYEAPDLACNEGEEKELRTRLQDCNGGIPAALYYHVTQRGFMAYIDYWWFLRFNDTDGGPVLDHQGDWEGAVVAVDTRDPSTFLWAAVAAHEGAPWRYPRALLRCEGGLPGSCGSEDRPTGRRLTVFVADGSHAGYTSPCSRRHIGSCLQNEWPPERGFDGFGRWIANDERGALKPLSLAPWHAWPGWWNRPRFQRAELPGEIRGSRVRSPGSQDRFKRPWRHRPTECHRNWCKQLLELARRHERSCRGQQHRALTARVCLAVPAAGKPTVTAGSRVTMRLFTARGRTRPVRSAQGPARGAASVDLAGSALVDGERLEITGRLPSGAAVLARGRGEDALYEAVFVVPASLTPSGMVELTADGRGEPRARLRLGNDRRWRKLEGALVVRVY
jgi:lysophospholipase L1-like esterase